MYASPLRPLLGIFASLALFATCGASFAPRSLGPAGAFGTGFALHKKIQHVIFIVQENRSFNNLFMGYPGALTRKFGYDKSGNRIRLHQQDLVTTWDIGHGAENFFEDYDNGKLDGWNDQEVCCGTIPSNFAYAYVTQSEIQPYWQMAAQYVLADHAFQSNLDGSFIAHQYTVAAYASHGVDFPTSYWGCPGGPSDSVPTLNQDRTYGPSIPVCFNNPTIANELDAKGLSWHFYTTDVNNFDGGLWNTYQAISSIYMKPDWFNNVITPQSQFLSDVAAGKLSNVTWVTPTFENSDHAGLDQLSGPPWVASLVNAVGESQFWNSSAIFVIWDDWGGWYDSVKPVYKDYDGLGFRIPLLMISPYARRGLVAHKQYETTSVLKFIENSFGLAPLAASDSRALDPALEAFNFQQKPRAFRAFAGGRPLQYWLRQPHPNAGRMPLDGD